MGELTLILISLDTVYNYLVANIIYFYANPHFYDLVLLYAQFKELDFLAVFTNQHVAVAGL